MGSSPTSGTSGAPLSLNADTLVVGAGPAGAAAALVLARAGRDVVLVDRRDFPRDKVCGDALIPDALRALDRLGVLPAVQREARWLDALCIHAPGGRAVRLPERFACLPRRILDDRLVQAARDAGARVLAGWEFRGPLLAGDRVAGGEFRRTGTGESRAVAAPWTLLATGASVAPLSACGVLRRASPSGMALRAYVAVPEDVDRDLREFRISYAASTSPGYGWIFPGPERVCNLGVGVFHDGRRPPAERNLRILWERFWRGFPPARELVTRGRLVAPLRGAPLRCAMTGSLFHRPGLLVLGEAAGLTFSFSGEGIGKALASGIAAAEALLHEREPGPAYERALRSRFSALYAGYRRAQDWLAHPRVADLLARRARPGSYAHQQLQGLLSETGDPRALFSLQGMLRAVLG